ncbi:MAG: glycoside hydrolase family 127 protein [Planctomycetaceae bacterium]|jgi:DUF1680 family protein|nr:glycoside hydrolase family 127 protein [Planctomycetaceae bacterium]
MRTLTFTTIFLLVAVFVQAEETSGGNWELQAVSFTDVQFDDLFWSPRLKTNREVSIPHTYDWCEKTGRLANFRNAAACLTGAQCDRFQGIFFNDSDVYKVIEGTAYTLASEENPVLMKQADTVIDSIAWNKAETFTIHRDVSIKRMVANPKVQADNGRVALQRGMVVYCFEECDNETPIAEIMLAKNPEFKEEWKEIAGDEGKSVKVIAIKCKNVDGKELTAIPYYAWDNRAKGAMSVWVQQDGLTNDVDSESPFWKTPAGEPILYRSR